MDIRRKDSFAGPSPVAVIRVSGPQLPVFPDAGKAVFGIITVFPQNTSLLLCGHIAVGIISKRCVVRERRDRVRAGASRWAGGATLGVNITHVFWMLIYIVKDRFPGIPQNGTYNNACAFIGVGCLTCNHHRLLQPHLP